MSPFGNATCGTAIEYYPTPGGVLIVTANAGECASCHAARYNFVNRAGQTVCLACDWESQRKEAPCASN